MSEIDTQEGEVIDDQTAPMFPDDQDVDPENPDGELAPEGAAPEGESEGVELTIAGFEEEAEPQEEATAPNWVKELRQRNREMQRELKELKKEREVQTKQVESVVVGEEPTFEGCGFDDEKFTRDYKAWVSRKSAFDQQEQTKKAQQEAEQKAWTDRLTQYDTQKKAIPVDDFEEAEATVQEALSQTQIGIMVKGAKRPAELVYALYKSPKALQALSAMKDPVEFAVAIGEMMANVKQQPKKSIPAPERVVRGGAGGRSPAMTSTNLEKLREEATKTGDYSKYMEAKRKAG